MLDICGALPKQRITEIFTTCQSNNFESLQARRAAPRRAAALVDHINIRILQCGNDLRTSSIVWWRG